MGWRILVNSLDRIEQELELGVAIVTIAPGMHAITGAKMFLSVTAKWLNVVNKAPVGSVRLGKQCVMHHFVYSPQCLGGQVADTIILPHSFCLVMLHGSTLHPSTDVKSNLGLVYVAHKFDDVVNLAPQIKK